MRSTTRVLRLSALALALVACNSDRLVAPGTTVAGSSALLDLAGPEIRISEFHYDNVGTDAGERIEVSGPAGASLAGWQIVRYNGSTATAAIVYTTPAGPAISGVFADQCGGRGTLVFSYPVDGLQNGNNDGFALVNPSGAVVELLSYEGVLKVSTAANGGVAAGMTSVDVGVAQSNATTPVGASIERTAAGTWVNRTVNSFGACNDAPQVIGPVVTATVTPASASITVGNSQTFTAKGFDAQGNQNTAAVFTWSSLNPDVVSVNATTGAATAVAVGDTKLIATTGTVTAEAVVHVLIVPPPLEGVPSTRIAEFHYDNTGTDANEGVEIEADAGVSLSGWSLVFYTGSTGTAYKTVELSGAVAATCNGRGAIAFPVTGIQNGGFDTPEPDGLALVNGTTAVQFLSYEGTFTATDGPAAGLTSVDVGIEEGSTSATQSIQLNTSGEWERKAASFGQVNACASATGTASISLSSNGPDTLVVGWQRRAFATYRDANGTVVSPTPAITWSSDTPTIASVDSRGYATALSAGTAVIRATIGTTTNTHSFAVIAYEPVIAAYRNHLEFGIPSGAPAGSEVYFKPGFVTSYNPARGGPNWVSWNLNASHFGDAERCECFSADVALPAEQRIVDSDYVGGGYDRGHMVQSESRTSTHSENASTFLMTNILPQAANNNQGPWLGFENFLNDRARVDGRQVYVVAGGEYGPNPATLKNEGRVAIPDYTWKVAIVVNNGAGLGDVHTTSDITVYAIRIPNLLATAPPKNNNYAPFITTIDDVEARTGYDFFAALPDNIERIVEANDRPPVAVLGGPTTGTEGSALTFDATGSTDPDAGDVLSYEWTFANGVTSTSPTPTVIFTDDGSYAATLTVTDKYGAESRVTTTITIANVAPAVPPLSGASILRGESYASAGIFSDPGADTFTATVNYGDGSGTTGLALDGSSYSLSHTYGTAGTFTVTVTITDDDGGATSRTAIVSVASAAQAIGTLSARSAELEAAGTLTKGEANALDASLRNALKSIQGGDDAAAGGQLGAFINKVEAMQRSGRLDPSVAAGLIDYAKRIIASLA
ncbi:MAG TPA: DNA/RNA non-specific endonuclease [Gemmatimonadaceae bacterium]|nr:DNA/RNA non-specific endonuclease [Gemmatimonadaceae bacterium]